MTLFRQIVFACVLRFLEENEVSRSFYFDKKEHGEDCTVMVRIDRIPPGDKLYKWGHSTITETVDADAERITFSIPNVEVPE